ncbi:MAG: hypothetical protein WBV74_15750 [Pseudonocardiaceae bacterium]
MRGGDRGRIQVRLVKVILDISLDLMQQGRRWMKIFWVRGCDPP